MSLVLLEAGAAAGGRVRSVSVDGLELEGGASIIHSSNAYLRNMSDAFNLTRLRVERENRRLGIWDSDARRLLLTTTDWPWLSLLRLLWRYGLSFFTLGSLVKQRAALWSGVYALQAALQAFDSPEQLLSALSLYSATQSSLLSFLSPAVSPLLLRELVTAVERVNYNQQLDVNGLAGSVGLIPALDDDLFAIEGGNCRLVQAAIQHSGAELRLQHRAEQLRYDSQQAQYAVSGEGWEERFDLVVLAAPLELSGLRLELTAASTPPPRAYQTTVATFVSGQLNHSYFGLSSAEELPSQLLTVGCLPEPACAFSSIGQYHRNASSGRSVYKIFSAAPLPSALLSSLFLDLQSEPPLSIAWQAYPQFRSAEQFSGFWLQLEASGAQAAGRLLYVNAFENAVSCMECAAVSAMNVALLASRRLQELRSLKGHRQAQAQPQHAAQHSEQTGEAGWRQRRPAAHAEL